jgi:hypothetical protein
MEKGEIDFSHVLKQSFHATLNGDKVEITKGKENEIVIMERKQEIESKQDLSIAACNILESLPRNMLTCPFCSEEYLFEFTMKEHLKKHHSEEIQKLDSWPVQQHFCPYCRAMFYYSSLIPKHIHFAHGKETLDVWFATDNNLQKFQIDKENSKDPSVRLLDCSPGLSELFNDLDTCDSVKKFKHGSLPSTPVSQPRSILKKTPYSGRIVILSPESAALRRTINSLKRSASARRALRFDLPPLAASPPEATQAPTSLPAFNLQTPPKKKFWNFFGSRKSPPPINTKIKKKIRVKACKMSNRSANQMITSTPMHCWDDSDDDGCDELDKDETIGSNWKSALKTSNFRPLFLAAERFQCNFCQAKFDSNAELLFHQKQNHRRISFLPPFKCGQCKSKFYRNSYLVRHCHFQHTPTKN